MNAIQTSNGPVQPVFTVLAETWAEDQQQRDFQIVDCLDANGRKFRGRVDFSANAYNFVAMVQCADLYVDGAGYVPRDAWRWGDDWKGTTLGDALGMN